MSMLLSAGREAGYRQARACALQAQRGIKRTYERNQPEDVCEQLSRIVHAALLRAVAMPSASDTTAFSREITDVERQEKRFGLRRAAVRLVR